MSTRADSPRGTDRDITVAEYYEDPRVQQAILAYSGGPSTPPTAVYLAGLCRDEDSVAAWDRHVTRVTPDRLDVLCSQSCDIARSLWDRDHLVFFLELDYENVDQPAEPYLRPAEVFFKLEPVYRAARRVFRRLGLAVHSIMTGRGYHFAGQISLRDPLIPDLAALLPDTPAWHAGLPARAIPGVSAHLSPEHASAAGGLGMLLEFVAHLILGASPKTARIPVVVNGTVVGTGMVGRECVSIDFSHAGDPLDVRHMRCAFSAYQWHLLRPDIFGPLGDRGVAALAAMPRGHQSLRSLLDSGRTLRAGRMAAEEAPVVLPEISGGVRRLLDAYRASDLATFHRAFYAQRSIGSPSIDLESLPPCLRASLVYPNDLLLKPEHVQHLVRGLMARDWRAADIAALVRGKYDEDHDWGDRWSRLDVQTRAEFDVRVFAGLIVTGLDSLIDFNCVSAQEKDVCPRAGCAYDLRRDRERLLRLRPS
jgi:hypothetical protein